MMQPLQQGRWGVRWVEFTVHTVSESRALQLHLNGESIFADHVQRTHVHTAQEARALTAVVGRGGL